MELRPEERVIHLGHRLCLAPCEKCIRHRFPDGEITFHLHTLSTRQIEIVQEKPSLCTCMITYEQSRRSTN